MDSTPTIQALVLTGHGINCNKEMGRAAALVGAQVTECHLDRLLEHPGLLSSIDWLLIPGGFSFGDELGAGHIFANKLMQKCQERLRLFVARGGSILGVCNGFQILLNLGLLPFSQEERVPAITLTNNVQGRFDNRWVSHTMLPSHCIYTEEKKSLLPIRHAEGRIVIKDQQLREELFARRQVPLVYSEGHNPNGSDDGIAGLCDETGRVLGLMAHPEAYLYPWHHPHWHRQQWSIPAQSETPEGLLFFQRAIQHLKSAKKVTA